MSKEPAYKVKLRDYVKGPLESGDLAALEVELFGASDRAAALLYCALVENALHRLISTKIRRRLNSADRREMFETFSRTISVAYALELIGPIARSDLDLIRFIRNNFAHSPRPLNFDVPEVGDVCAALQYPDFPDAKAPAGPSDSTLENLIENENVSKSPEFRRKRRNRYTMACHTLSYRMLGVVQLPSTAATKLFGDPALP